MFNPSAGGIPIREFRICRIPRNVVGTRSQPECSVNFGETKKCSQSYSQSKVAANLYIPPRVKTLKRDCSDFKLFTFKGLKTPA